MMMMVFGSHWRPLASVGAVLQDLEQDVHLGVGLLDLVEQDHRVALAPDGLGQLPALVGPT
jgi:hypothetical protein